MEKHTVRWQCTHCGKKVVLMKEAGRPPMTTCRDNKGKPHTWRKLG